MAWEDALQLTHQLCAHGLTPEALREYEVIQQRRVAPISTGARENMDDYYRGHRRAHALQLRRLRQGGRGAHQPVRLQTRQGAVARVPRAQLNWENNSLPLTPALEVLMVFEVSCAHVRWAGFANVRLWMNSAVL